MLHPLTKLLGDGAKEAFGEDYVPDNIENSFIDKIIRDYLTSRAEGLKKFCAAGTLDDDAIDWAFDLSEPEEKPKPHCICPGDICESLPNGTCNFCSLPLKPKSEYCECVEPLTQSCSDDGGNTYSVWCVRCHKPLTPSPPLPELPEKVDPRYPSEDSRNITIFIRETRMAVNAIIDHLGQLR